MGHVTVLLTSPVTLARSKFNTFQAIESIFSSLLVHLPQKETGLDYVGHPSIYILDQGTIYLCLCTLGRSLRTLDGSLNLFALAAALGCWNSISA